MSTTTTTVVPCKLMSPTSVVHDDSHHVVEPLKLPDAKESDTKGETMKQNKKRTLDAWVCPASAKSMRTQNPIRKVIDPIAGKIKLGFQRPDRKNPISLATGDASASGSLPPCTVAVEAAVKALLSNDHAASYSNACGTNEARLAIAKHHSYSEIRVSPDNVIVANGCSGALELALTSLLDPGTTLLVPSPGFPLYQVIAESHGAKVIQYRLNPDRNWECDMDHLKEIISTHSDIRAMVVNNPSSPTGCVFSESHIVEILEFARVNRLPIVSDEVYGDLTFGSNKFYPMAQIAARLGRHVPVITTSGLSKQYLLPGWRIGWLAFHDNVSGSLKEVLAGAKRLAQVTMGISHPAQAVIPTILNPVTPGMATWKQHIRNILERQSKYLSARLAHCQGLTVVPPQGSMYAIVKIDTSILNMKDDIEFASKLLEEENVFVLPGSSMGAQNVFRVVYCSPEKVLEAASNRIENFCRRHCKN